MSIRTLWMICFFSMCPFALTAQVIIAEFEAKSTAVESEANRFRNQLHSNMSNYFHLMEREESNLERIRSEIQRGVRDRTLFQGAISPRFEHGVYIVSGEVSESAESGKVDLTVRVFYAEAAKNPETYSLRGVNPSDLNKVARLMASSIRYKLPIYFDAEFIEKTRVFNNDILSIPYGKDRGASFYEPLEVYRLTDRGRTHYIGKARVRRAGNESAHVRVSKSYFRSESLSDKDLILQTITNHRKSERYKRRIEKLQLPEHNNWIIFTANSFHFYDKEFSKYFNEPDLMDFDPVFLGLQINLGKSNNRMFLKGKASLPHKFWMDDTQMDVSMMTAGLGLQNQFNLLGFLFPGFSLGVNYARFEKSPAINTLNLRDQVYHGVDLEATGNITVRISKVGLFGEIAYHYMPVLAYTSNQRLSTTALSIGVGITAYF